MKEASYVGGWKKAMDGSVLTAVVWLSHWDLSQPINSLWWNIHIHTHGANLVMWTSQIERNSGSVSGLEIKKGSVKKLFQIRGPRSYTGARSYSWLGVYRCTSKCGLFIFGNLHLHLCCGLASTYVWCNKIQMALCTEAKGSAVILYCISIKLEKRRVKADVVDSDSSSPTQVKPMQWPWIEPKNFI